MRAGLRLWSPALWGVVGTGLLAVTLPLAGRSTQGQAPTTAAVAPAAVPEALGAPPTSPTPLVPDGSGGAPGAGPMAAQGGGAGQGGGSGQGGGAGQGGVAPVGQGPEGVATPQLAPPPEAQPPGGETPSPPTPPGAPPGEPVAVQCVGSPPRQAFAVYSAPCAGPFSGDNGGATAPGVTATEVRVAVLNNNTSYQGLVPTSPQRVETAGDRTYRVLQEWFSRRYQFYGRRLQLVSLPAERGNTQQEAAVKKAKVEFNSFGLVFNSGAASYAGPDQQLVTFSSYRYPRSVYEERKPFLWTHGMDNTATVELGAEYLCKKLAGKPAEFTDDPQLRPPLKPERRFGVLFFAEDDFALNGPAFENAARDECGLDVVTAGYRSDEASMATAVTKLIDAEVTTAVFLTEFVTGRGPLAVATARRWFPEWIVLGFGGADVNTLASTLPPEQWRHAFGMTSGEIPIDDAASDWWRAYKEIDPEGRPDAEAAKFLWPHLTQLANGIQMAGPRLTPNTFRNGLYAMGRTRPRAVWATGGGFAPGDHSYVDYVAEIWWDPSSSAYRFTRGGRRYAKGELDADTSQLFQAGITKAPG